MSTTRIRDHMLIKIPHNTHALMELINSDPVRPHVPTKMRVGKNADVLVLLDEQDEPTSVVCASFGEIVPSDENELFLYDGDTPTVASLYTIWSLTRGGGSHMVRLVPNWLRQHRPTVNRLVTLSPPTAMAERFHITHGAHLLRTNPLTVNFEYPFDGATKC
jgi:hypothetical protein